MSQIKEKSLAVTDILVAVLRDSEVPLSTKEVAARAGFYPTTQHAWGQWEAYALLRRLERHGTVAELRFEEHPIVYWSIASDVELVSLADMPPDPHLHVS